MPRVLPYVSNEAFCLFPRTFSLKYSALSDKNFTFAKSIRTESPYGQRLGWTYT